MSRVHDPASAALDVLLVEDLPSDQALVRESLADAPNLRARLHLAESLAEALERIADAPPDVALLDLGLPDSRGIETFRRLRATGTPVPIVVLSGLTDHETALVAIREGAQDYLYKGDLAGPMLARVLRYAVERGRLERAVTASERRFRALVERNQDAIVLLGRDGEITFASPAASPMAGLSVDELLGANARELLDPRDRDRFLTAFRQVVANGGNAGPVIGRVRHADGGWRTIDVVLRDLLGDPAVEAVVANLRDVTEQEERRQELLMYQAIVQHTRDGVLVTDGELDPPGPRIRYANPAMTRMSGYGRDELIGATPRLLQGPGTERAALDRLRAALQRGEAHRTELVNHTKDGRAYVTELDVVPIAVGEGFGRRFISVQRDVTERRRAALRDRRFAEVHEALASLAQEALEEGIDLRTHAQATLDAAVDLVPGAEAGSVLRQGADGHYRYVAANAYGPALLRVAIAPHALPDLMRSEGPLIVRSWPPNPHLDPATAETIFGASGRASEIRASLVVPVRIDGHLTTWMMLDSFADADAFSDEDVAIGRLFARHVGMVAKRLGLERELATQARTDPVTGLPNRRAAEERLAELAEARVGATLYFLEVDEFKTANEAYGHAIGDALLVALGARLHEVAPPGSLVFRWEGDKFVVLEATRGDVAAARRTARRLEAAMDREVTVDGGTFATSVSIGVAVVDRLTGEADWRLALRQADIALHASMRYGTHQTLLYDDALRLDVERRAAIGRRLRDELRDGGERLTLHYQPRVRLADGAWSGVEALARWSDPVLGPVPPDAFIPVAESTGLIHPLTAHVLDLAVRQAGRWRTAGTPMNVSVNLSAEDLRRDDLAERVFATLARHGVAPDLLVVEVTESAVMRDVDRARRQLRALRSGGVRVAVDDFGTAYSSLAYLKTLPLDVLKIDRAFVQDVASDDPDTASAEGIVRTIVAMAHALGLSVVAEGVETERQAAFLRDVGCEAAQGWLFARPVPADELRLPT